MKIEPSVGPEGFGLYIHWPFCLSKCPYCDFNSHVSDHVDQARWRAGLLAELEHYAAQAGRRRLTSIFFGGGTPSLMDPATTAALIARARELFATDDTLEISLEANPGAVDRARFEGFREAGVNRVSLGVQALDEEPLRFLGRRHDAAEAVKAVESAAALFPRTSFDLIYARPGQPPESWREELSRALGHAGGHLSLYQLTIEPGTKFFTEYNRGAFALPDEDDAVALWDVTQGVLEAHGLPAYEVSNHARPGQECRHNLTYWRGGDYIGIGPGAHGRLTRDGTTHATRQHRAPDIWLKRVEAIGHATQETTPLTLRERAEELIMMGLRLREGVDAAVFQRLAGQPLEGVVDPEGLEMLVSEGLVFDGRTNGTSHLLRVTPQGMLALNSVIGALLRG